MRHDRTKEGERGSGYPILPENVVQAAATVTSGLIAVHGIDAGGIPPEELAARALEIVYAICDAVYAPPAEATTAPPAEPPPPPPEEPVAAKAEAPRKHGWHR